jgi:hypothetical protein
VSSSPRVRGWIRSLNLDDGPLYGTLGAKIVERAVTVQLGGGGKLDVFLEDDGSLHVVARGKGLPLVGRGADGDGIEISVRRGR